MAYEVLLAEQPREFLATADDKTARIVKDKLRALADDPYPRPGSGVGDREKITVDGRDVIRMHISRSSTAFYTVHENELVVRVREILPIDEAHKRYD